MSTYLYLVCLHHEPHIKAEGESGQHTYDLPQIREDIANRERLVAAWDALDQPDLGSHFRPNTLRFLAAHPKCQVGIKDEYGKWHPLVEGSEVSEGRLGDNMGDSDTRPAPCNCRLTTSYLH